MSVPPRAAALVERLGLQPHPEGGYFREIFRSPLRVQPLDGRPPRSALTTIHFLLAAGEHSRWHRVSSDEAWHFAEGDPLDLYWIEEGRVRHEVLSAAGAEGGVPACVVPAGCWQAARPRGAYSLVGCSVGPGFDFADFEMISPDSPLRETLRALPDAPEGLE